MKSKMQVSFDYNYNNNYIMHIIGVYPIEKGQNNDSHEPSILN